MTDEIYPLMCQTSPVQKEWKPKVGDIIHIAMKGEVLKPATIIAKDFRKKRCHTFLPRQEDWQEILKGHPSLEYFTKVCNEVVDSRIVTKTVSDLWTIYWCLFVHKEVYNLVWNWEEKKWKEQ